MFSFWLAKAGFLRKRAYYPCPIKTYLKQLIAKIFKNDKVEVFVIAIIAVSLLTYKGTAGEGQGSFFQGFVEKYVEETAAAVIEPSQNQLADVNSLFALSGRLNKHIAPSLNTVQENSVIAYGPVLESATGDFVESGNEVVTYTVQEGDTLSFIASDFGISVNTIIWANKLKNINDVKPGQELKIPPVTGVVHRVAKGDTLALIAKKYSAEQDRIISFNELSQAGDLQIGEQLIIPDGKIAPEPKSRSSVAVIQKSTAQRFLNLPNLSDFFGIPTILGFNWGKIHGRNGVDVANSCGTPLFAAADGVVTLAKSSGWNGGFGKFIKISHANGTETLYAHASKLMVEVGQNVSKGSQIALMGTTGRSTGCHVHFEVHGAKNPLAKR